MSGAVKYYFFYSGTQRSAVAVFKNLSEYVIISTVKFTWSYRQDTRVCYSTYMEVNFLIKLLIKSCLYAL